MTEWPLYRKGNKSSPQRLLTNFEQSVCKKPVLPVPPNGGILYRSFYIQLGKRSISFEWSGFINISYNGYRRHKQINVVYAIIYYHTNIQQSENKKDLR